VKSLALTIALLLCLASSLVAEDKPGGIGQDLLDKYQGQVEKNKSLKASINAVTGNTIKNLALDREKVLSHDRMMRFKLESNGITNQRSSGRCWLFAGLNVITPKVMTKLDKDAFELSQPYVAFYDKLEKANMFLEKIIYYRDKPIDDRALAITLQYPFGDGGWYPYFTDLMKKYGVVPLSAMPETKQSAATGRINSLITTLIRGHGAELRRMHQDGKKLNQLRARKEEMMSEVYQMLVFGYGQPPEEFTFKYEAEFEDADTTEAESDSAAVEDDSDSTESESKPEKEWVIETHTPHSFYDTYVSEFMKDCIMITNSPTQKYNQLFELEESRNIWEYPDQSVLNMPIEKLKHYAHQSLLDSQAVWFACDVGKDNYNDSGVFMVDIYDYQSVFGVDFSMSKTDRIDFWDISPNHAMTLMGFDSTDTGEPYKWLVENSWGSKPGEGGRWYLYNNWFDEFVLGVIIDKELLSDEDRALLDMKPTKIKTWAPFFKALTRLP